MDMTDSALRLEALRLALNYSDFESAEDILKRAEAYYKFLQKGCGDNDPN